MSTQGNISLAQDPERLRALRAKRIRAYFDLAERAARIGYWRSDITDRSMYWSPGMYLLLGTEPQARPPDSAWLLEQLVPKDRDGMRAAIMAAIETRQSFVYRAKVGNPALPVQYIDVQGEVEIDETGRVTAVMGVCHDVTDRVRAQQDGRRAEQMYRVMAEESSDIIMFYAPGGKILFASRALERILKRTPHEIENNFRALVHPDDDAVLESFSALPVPNVTRSATYRVLHGNGHYVWIETTLRGVFDETGEYANLISVSRDVTERKQYEMEINAAREHAEAANRSKSRFLANMSHELRTPLNAIIGFTDLMRQEMFGPLNNERYEEYTTLIYDSGQLLLDLISDLLDMSKIEAGKLDLNMERIDLAAAVEDCIRLLRERADNGGLELTTALPKGKLSLVADRRAVKQILLNLVSNAVKFTPAGGHVVVGVKVSGGRAILSVRDDGIGIPAADLPRIGKPFEQVAGDPMLAKPGTGLGLSLVRALAERHGGAMHIQSQEGIGTEVTVELPLAPAKSKTKTAANL
ncbi:MAG TPA: ATP-binding protein [Rhizomicrobium sp.]